MVHSIELKMTNNSILECFVGENKIIKLQGVLHLENSCPENHQIGKYSIFFSFFKFNLLNLKHNV